MKVLVLLLSKLALTFVRNTMSKNKWFPKNWKEAACQAQQQWI
jgi:hypothetical protein